MKALKVITAATILALSALGCAQVSLPEKDLAGRLEYDVAAKARYRLDPNWWWIYKDDGLNQLVELALKNNLDLAQAAISINRALYQAHLLSGDLVPQFSGGASGTASQNIKDGGPSSRAVSGNLSLSYELDLWGRLANTASAQQWEYLATVEDRETARLALVGSVIDTYFKLAYLNEAIKATDLNLKNYQAIESTVQAKVRAGKVAAVESAQARQAVLNAESNLVDLGTQHKTAEQTLRNLLNLKPDSPLPQIGAGTLTQLQLPPLDLNVPLSVLANRPDLKAAEFRLHKSFKNVEAAEKAWLPSITLGAALSSTGDKINTALEAPLAKGTVSINLPFLDWNTVLWQLRISEADFEKIRLDFEKTLTQALNEVDTYYYSYQSARQTLDIVRKKYMEDQRISNYYQSRYQAGAGELSDWLSALNTLNSSRLAALEALYRTVQYENMTYKAMAGRYTDKNKF